MNGLETVLRTFLEGRGKARSRAEEQLLEADPVELLRVGLPALPDLKSNKAEQLHYVLSERLGDLDVQRVPELVDPVLAALQTSSRRANYWETELAQYAAPTAAIPAVETQLCALLMHPEKKFSAAKRACIAELLGKSGSLKARRLLATRARLDRERPGGLDASMDRLHRNYLSGDHPPIPKPAQWRERVNYALSQQTNLDVLPTLLLEVSGPWVANASNLWDGIARIAGADALDWIVQRYRNDPLFVTGLLRIVGGEKALMWMRCMTASRMPYAQLYAAMHMAELVGRDAAPWLKGLIDKYDDPLVRSGIDSSAKDAWRRARRVADELGGLDGVDPRIGPLPGDASPFSDLPDDDAPQWLALTDEQLADLDEQERAFVMTEAELSAF